MKRSNRTYLAVAAAAAAAVALAGCSGSAAGASNPASITAKDDGAKLTLWVRPGNEAVTDAVVKQYNETHKNQVAITHVPADQYVTKYAQASQSGSLPDILAADLVFMPQIVKNGSAVDLTSLLKKSGAFGHLSPAHEQAATSNGRVYGVPYVADTSLYLYNKDLFAKAGLDPDKPPTTWDGIIQAADAITKLGNGTYGAYISGDAPGSLAYDFTPTIWAQGQDVVKKDGSFDFDNAATQKALGFMQTLYQHGDIPASSKTDTGDGFFSVFATGKVGINFSGGNGVNTATLGKSPAFSFGLAPIPGAEDGKFATFSGGDVASITTQSKHQDEAWDFIDWLTSAKTSTDVYLKLPALAPRTDVTVPTTLGEQFTVPAELVKHGQTYVSTHYNDVIASTQGPWLQMFQSVVFDGKDPADATKTAQSAADALTSK
ncbi:ABC transporter substrate-binding protein [Microbacterium rhizosphaerae]|uniref:Sugar ABC transporter substrate-binding protein n=1 Tax=Microbacterium rhizosphaerae TaxID=1678237 RepID=A0ABZ0SJY8_9MICO|nr:sugar ABC transporter substrate-binding protein [Microbacterium rhizosphaerae]WPR89712.1 sugar ABC transporter substrate-binding protein [Microbacterium rhizosphaerae]